MYNYILNSTPLRALSLCLELYAILKSTEERLVGGRSPRILGNNARSLEPSREGEPEDLKLHLWTVVANLGT
jgi:hypothetical protein